MKTPNNMPVIPTVAQAILIHKMTSMTTLRVKEMAELAGLNERQTRRIRDHLIREKMRKNK
jgi:hypothetical protein